MEIARRCVLSPMGPLALEASADGLVAMHFRRTATRLGPPAAERALDAAAAWLDAYFGRRPVPAHPPLAATGTHFQRAVWRQLCAIPRGASATYGAIAAALGRRGGARAVGQANGRNPLPIFVPCHRVLAAGGRLGGYSAGLGRKRWLLAHEGMKIAS